MKLGVTFAVVASTALACGLASAQISDGERKAAARIAYKEGVEFQDHGKPAEALARFEAAQKLYDAPTHLLHIAECQALTGRLVEASETYESLVRKTLPADAPEAFTQAQQQGKAELDALRPRIPTLKISVKPEPRSLSKLSITANERQLPPEIVGLARPVNPGAYKLSATADGWATASPTAVEIADKDRKDVDLVLVQTKPGSPTAAPPAYDATKPVPRPLPKPASTGFLLGGRVGVFVPSGKLTESRSFDDYASAGPGFGLDGYFRFARIVLVGGTFEYTSLGAPEGSSLGVTLDRADVSARSFLGAFAVGIASNIDKVSFLGDVTLGYRSLSRDVSFPNLKGEESFGGFQFGLNGGLSIPVGPIRIVPRAGLSFASLGNRKCNVSGANAAAGAALCPQEAPPSTGGGSLTSPEDSTSGSLLFNVALGVYFSRDISKPDPPVAGRGRSTAWR